MDDNFRLANLDLEQQVLGQIVGHGQFSMYQAAGLTPAAFYREEHIDIYKAAEKLHQKGITADVMTIR